MENPTESLWPDPSDGALLPLQRDAAVPFADWEEDRELEGGGARAPQEGLPKLRLLGVR